MGEESITIGKNAICGIIIVLLAGLLVVSIFTQGFGIVKADCPDVVNVTDCPDTTPPVEDNTTEQPALPQITVEFGSYPPLGDENAPVALVQFSDYQCPYCARLYSQGEAQLKTSYVAEGKLKLYFRDYPLYFHQWAGYAAVAATCADEQGKFWEMHGKLFESQGEWSASDVNASMLFKGYAVELGMDNETFNTCYDNQTHVEKIIADMTEGQSYAYVLGKEGLGTPSNFLIIPKSKVNGDDLKAVVASINDEGGTLVLLENENEYTVLVPGAYSYNVFDAVLSTVDY